MQMLVSSRLFNSINHCSKIYDFFRSYSDAAYGQQVFKKTKHVISMFCYHLNRRTFLKLKLQNNYLTGKYLIKWTTLHQGRHETEQSHWPEVAGATGYSLIRQNEWSLPLTPLPITTRLQVKMTLHILFSNMQINNILPVKNMAHCIIYIHAHFVLYLCISERIPKREKNALMDN